MRTNDGNWVIHHALMTARMAHVTNRFGDYTHGYSMGMINIAHNFLQADRIMVQAARNEITFFHSQMLDRESKK